MSEKSKAVPRNCTKELLEELYKNVGMEAESITGMLSKTKGAELSAELTKQLGGYGNLSRDIQTELKAVTGEMPDVSMLTKMTAKIGVEMSTLTDSSDNRIAQMAIESATMGITDNIRLVRDYENSNCSESALKLAKNVVSFQENAVERMKSFL